ncbi:MAG: zinc ribbon domain-containing protein [Planctomycetes bacterium]|nr:zinc ribbon domain-containing protein [Planctomycetota bacterium]
MSIAAVCPQCAKRYRVPHAERAWSCKACGAALELAHDEAESDAGDEAPSCPSCGAEASPADAFCEACGHALSGSSETARRAEAKVAGAEMRKAMKRVRTLKTMLWVSLLFSVFQLLVLVLASFRPEADAGTMALLLGLVGAICLLNLVAVYKVESHPLPVVLGVAALKTVDTSLLLMGGIVNLVSIGVTAWLWAAVVAAARLSRLAKEHPDLYLSRRMRGELDTHRDRLAQGSSVGRRHRDRARSRDRGGALRLVAIGVALVALLGAGFWGLRSATGPTSPAAMLEDFRDAWNRADTAAVGAFAASANRDKWTSNVEKLQERYAWGDALPPLERVEVELFDGAAARAKLHGPAGALGVRLTWEEERWCLASLDLRSVKDWRP